MRAFLIVSAALAATAFAGERYALVIGIDGYQELGRLKACVADAEGLAKVLAERAGFDPKKIVLLTDNSAEPQNKPTLATMRRRIAQVASLVEADDALLVFFSGHGETALDKNGEKRGYLIPVDGSTTPNEQGEIENAIPLTWIKGRLDACKATNKILILDTCHAGSATKGVGGISGSLPGLSLLLSCTEKQVSYVDEAAGLGVFSRYLIEGLSGAADANKDKEITLAELFAFVKERMKDWSLSTGRNQVPVLDGVKAEVLSVARVLSDQPYVPQAKQTQEQAQLAAAAYPVFVVELGRLKAAGSFGDAFAACRGFLAAHLGTPEADKVRAIQQALREEFDRIRDDHDRRFRQAIEKGDFEACRRVVADLNRYSGPEILEDRNRMLAAIMAAEQAPGPNNPQAPTKAILAKVVGVDTKLGLVIINVGQQQGVKNGQNFIVFRGSKYIGKIAVFEVFPDVTACRYVVPDMKGDVEVGDDVASRLTPP